MWAYDRPLYKAEYLADFLLENGGRIVEETLKHLTCQSKKCISESTHFRANKWNHFKCSLPKAFWIWCFYDLSIALYLSCCWQALSIEQERPCLQRKFRLYIGSDLISLIQGWDHKKHLSDLPIKAPLRDQLFKDRIFIVLQAEAIHINFFERGRIYTKFYIYYRNTAESHPDTLSKRKTVCVRICC